MRSMRGGVLPIEPRVAASAFAAGERGRIVAMVPTAHAERAYRRASTLRCYPRSVAGARQRPHPRPMSLLAASLTMAARGLARAVDLASRKGRFVDAAFVYD